MTELPRDVPKLSLPKTRSWRIDDVARQESDVQRCPEAREGPTAHASNSGQFRSAVCTENQFHRTQVQVRVVVEVREKTRPGYPSNVLTLRFEVPAMDRNLVSEPQW